MRLVPNNEVGMPNKVPRRGTPLLLSEKEFAFGLGTLSSGAVVFWALGRHSTIPFL